MTAPLVVGIAAVAHGEVEETVGSKGDAPSVVIEPRLVDLEQHALRGGVKARPVVFHDFEFGQAQRVVPIGGRLFSQRGAVGQIDLAVLLEMRVQRQAEQAAFVESLIELGQPAAHVEERLLRFRAILRQHADDADLVRHQQSAGTVFQRE